MFDIVRRHAAEQWGTLLTVLSLIGSGTALTSLEVGRRSGLGRTATTQRVNQLKAAGLVEESGLAASTGGRAARQLRFRHDAGCFLVAHLEVSSVYVAVTDLLGRPLAQRDLAMDVSAHPNIVLAKLEDLFEKVAREAPRRPVWAVAVGVPGPVEFATGRPLLSALIPSWADYSISQRLSRHFNAPTWIDNNVNLMALGESTADPLRDEANTILIKVGSGIGAALISQGKLHRGTDGVAGEIGHVQIIKDDRLVCSCGKSGCLEAVAGSDALRWQAIEAARDGRSGYLAGKLGRTGTLSFDDLIEAVAAGDPAAVSIIVRSGQHCGDILARLVNFFNPSRVIVAGSVARAGDVFLASIRQEVYRLGLPVATRNLAIDPSTMGMAAGLRGAATLAIEELFTPETFAAWFHEGSPAGLPHLGQGWSGASSARDAVTGDGRVVGAAAQKGRRAVAQRSRAMR